MCIPPAESFESKEEAGKPASKSNGVVQMLFLRTEVL